MNQGACPITFAANNFALLARRPTAVAAGCAFELRWSQERQVRFLVFTGMLQRVFSLTK
jgi:hypothetical protein